VSGRYAHLNPIPDDPPIQENNQVFPVPVGFAVDQRIRLVVQTFDRGFDRGRCIHSLYPVAQFVVGGVGPDPGPLSVRHFRQCFQNCLQAFIYPFSAADHGHLSI